MSAAPSSETTVFDLAAWRAVRYLKLSDRTLPWARFQRFHDLHYAFWSPIERGYRYIAMPDDLAPQREWLLSRSDPCRPGVIRASSQWYKDLREKFARRYRTEGIERYFRPLENALLAESNRRSGWVQCAVTNRYFEIGERGPLSPISAAGSAMLRKRRSQASTVIEERLRRPMPPQRRGNEEWFRCPCCLLWIDLEAMRQRLARLSPIRWSPHVLRNHRGDNELLRFPVEPTHLFFEGSFSKRGGGGPLEVFASVADPKPARYEVDGVPLNGETWKEAWIRGVIMSARGKRFVKKRHRMPPRLQDDDYYAQSIIAAAESEVESELGKAPVKKPRDMSLIIEDENASKVAAYPDDDAVLLFLDSNPALHIIHASELT